MVCTQISGSSALWCLQTVVSPSFSLRGTPHLCARHLALFVTNFDSWLFVAVTCFTLSVWSPV